MVKIPHPNHSHQFAFIRDLINSFEVHSMKPSRRKLALSVVLLAAGMNLTTAARAVDTLTIQNQTYSSGQSEQVVANVQISADTNVTVSSGATVKYVAGTRIVLGPGFRALAGSSFRASIDLALQNPNADDDGDGFSNAWEITHGFDPHNPNDTRGDSNGDGIPNWLAVLLKTEPNRTLGTENSNTFKVHKP